MLQYAVAPRGEDMEKFNRALRGYDPEEVNAFLDQVITQVEKMIAEGKEKDKKISTKDIENKALIQHIEFCIQVGIWSGIELQFVQEEWERLIKNYKE